MRRQGTPVSREALYEEIWTDAVTVVAPRYGLSDVGLVKICKKLAQLGFRQSVTRLRAGKASTDPIHRGVHEVSDPLRVAGSRYRHGG